MQKEIRPWGNFRVIAEGDDYKVKEIVVNSGQKLSLQYHNRRSEYWVVVSGTADIVRGEEQMKLPEGNAVFIPCGLQHRIMNNTKEDLIVIETQIGDYLEEDDIVRIEDDYGRVAK